MVINDLKKICPTCRGAGRTAGISDGGIAQINLAGTCPACGGRGFQLTELGRDVVDLLRPFIEEMIAVAKPKAPPRPAAGDGGEKE